MESRVLLMLIGLLCDWREILSDKIQTLLKFNEDFFEGV